MSSRSALALFTLFCCASAMVRRQAYESDEMDNTDFENVGGWNAFVRDKTDLCSRMAEKGGPEFCSIFNMCCDMGFDPLNGDKCQVLDKSCMSTEEAVCVFRNCTELITTTTTTTEAVTDAQTSTASTVACLTALFSYWVMH